MFTSWMTVWTLTLSSPRDGERFPIFLLVWPNKIARGRAGPPPKEAIQYNSNSQSRAAVHYLVESIYYTQFLTVVKNAVFAGASGAVHV